MAIINEFILCGNHFRRLITRLGLDSVPMKVSNDSIIFEDDTDNLSCKFNLKEKTIDYHISFEYASRLLFTMPYRYRATDDD